MSIELAPTISGAPVRMWKRYPAYRDSGVKWLGAVPEGWGEKRLKYIASESLKYGANESAELDDPDLPRYIRITDIAENGSLRVDTFKSLPEDVARPYLLKSGDILFARSGATVGKSFIYHESWGRACYAGYLIRLRINSRVAAPEFISYFASSSAYWDWASSIFIQATIQHISAEKYANFSVAIPPLPEQRTIAAFLDRETGRIDALIAKKERQIELLQEKRAALISHAVTNGLDPDVPMKDSGVEWLGEVPAHWNILALRRVVSRFVDYRGKTPQKVDRGVPLITAKNIKDGHIDLSQSQEFMREDEYQDWMTRGWPEIGDVLITTEAPLGEVAQVEDTFIALAQRIILLKVNKSRIINDYLKYHFLSMSGQGELWTRASGSTALGIKAERFKGTLVSVPPLNEQQKITRYLDSEISCLEIPSSKIRESISKLREYRAALISAAVTGNIDVRAELVS